MEAEGGMEEAVVQGVEHGLESGKDCVTGVLGLAGRISTRKGECLQR